MNTTAQIYTQNNQQRPNKEIGAYVSIRYVVMSVLNRLRDRSMNQYRYLLQLAIDGVRETRLYHEASIEVAYLEMNPETGIVEFPSDMIDYIKIGIPIQGQLYNLTVNDSLLLNRAQKCGVDLRQMLHGEVSLPSGSGGYYYTDHFRGNNWITGLYGLTGGFNIAYYRIDNKMRRIEFQGCVPNSEIVIEYKSTGINAGAVITAQSIGVLRNYVLWQMDEYDPRVPNTQKERRKAQYEEEVEKLRWFTNKFTLQEFLDSQYETFKQSPKR